MINYEIPHNEQSYEEHIIAIHLKELISDNTAKKIINGVPVLLDGKRLINKKSIKTFLDYLGDEMYKQAVEQRKNNKKGNKNWTALAKDGNFIIERALAYFDDDTIHGDLFTEDGELFKTTPTQTPKNVVKSVQATTVTRKPEPPKPQQFTLFSFLEEQKSDTSTTDEEDTDDLEETDDMEDTDDMDDTEDTESPTEDLTVKKSTAENVAQNEKKEPDIPQYVATYLHYKKQYPDHIVLYRVGDFYESLNDDAKTLARNFDLTLTARQIGEGRVPMIGIPYHVKEQYFFKFSELYQLVVIDGDNIEIIPVAPMEDDEDIDDDELSEEEMKEFDGYMGDPIPAKTPITEDTDEDDEDMEDLLAYKKFIDSDALAVFVELFDGKLDIQ